MFSIIMTGNISYRTSDTGSKINNPTPATRPTWPFGPVALCTGPTGPSGPGPEGPLRLVRAVRARCGGEIISCLNMIGSIICNTNSSC